jgi:hypothetical protein
LPAASAGVTVAVTVTGDPKTLPPGGDTVRLTWARRAGANASVRKHRATGERDRLLILLLVRGVEIAAVSGILIMDQTARV